MLKAFGKFSKKNFAASLLHLTLGLCYIIIQQMFRKAFEFIHENVL